MPVSSSALVRRIARRILADIDAGTLPPGTRLKGADLALRHHVSRSPIERALLLLEDAGVAARAPNRGFLVTGDRDALARAAQALAEPEAAQPYLQIAADRLAGRLPEFITERLLADRYQVTGAVLRQNLTRMALEHWIERRPGYGWRFLPVLDSAEAHAASYRFRLAIEPAALLEPGYRVDAAAFAKVRAQQMELVTPRPPRLGSNEWFDIGTRFHATIVGCCGNPFFIEASQRANRLRRLIVYRPFDDTQAQAFAAAAREHLKLLDLIEAGRREQAARRLRAHLEDIRQVKADLLGSDPVPAGSTRRRKPGERRGALDVMPHF
jgi:DNA-binding GntR family transcriptional regulator